MQTKALIFDADGMVVHGTRFSIRLEKEFGISTEITAPFFRNEFQLCLIGKIDLKVALVPYLRQWNWKGSVDEFLRVWFADEHTQIDTRFVSIIGRIREKGTQVHLATNNEKYRIHYLVETRGLGKWFDGIFSSADIGAKKTDIGFWNHIFVHYCRFSKKSVTVWDDDEENLKVAEAFGLCTEHYKNFDGFVQKTKMFLE